MLAASLATISPLRMTDLAGSSRSTLTSRGNRRLKRDPLRLKKFYLVAELVDLDAEAVELDFVLPVVAARRVRLLDLMLWVTVLGVAVAVIAALWLVIVILRHR